MWTKEEARDMYILESLRVFMTYLSFVFSLRC